jgi:hypothetical protein
LTLLARGTCAGHALRDLHASVILLAASLADDIELLGPDQTIGAESVVRRWMAWQNTRSMVLLGDPAARIQPPHSTA